MTEPRSLWLRTQSGIPVELVWALCKLEAECACENIEWEAAISAADEAEGGWDATLTAWRLPPELCVSESLSIGPATLVGRVLTVGDCTFDLDTVGRPVPGSQEPLAPDTTVGNTEDLVAHAETLGETNFIEKTTLKRCRVYTTEPGDPFDGGAVDSAFYRQDSDDAYVRVEA